MTDERVYMLNALWFRPDGGAERYNEYIEAIGPLLQRYGGKKTESYVPEESVIGEFDADLVFVVEWPRWESFQSFIRDPEFKAVRHLREESITNSLLVRCRKPG